MGCKALKPEETESTFDKMPDEPESRGQWEIGRGMKRESFFEEPERKFRGKEQQEPRGDSNSSQASFVPGGFNIFWGWAQNLTPRCSRLDF